MAVLTSAASPRRASRAAVLVSAVVLVVSACTGATTPPPSTGSSPGASVAATPRSSQAPIPTPTAAAASPAGSPQEAASATPASTGTLRPTESPVVASGPWQPAGNMDIPRAGTHALLLNDGRVLTVGNDGPAMSSLRDDTAAAGLWDPSSRTWSSTAPLNRPRGYFAAGVLRDGRVLVAGGIDRGVSNGSADPGSSCLGSDATSYSSAYLFDPAAGTWSRAAPMSSARAEPSMVVLPDGRALVAGGFYIVGGTAVAPWDVALAAFHGTQVGNGAPSDVAPNFTLPPLATAELFDPSTGTWSSTGPMHYARYGAAMTVLADGRVLVVGSGQGAPIGRGGQVETNDSAVTSAEIYDPASGRFSVTGSLPQGDRLPRPDGAQAGTLVSLPDGGALLVANDFEWKHGGWDVRSFRYDAATGSWHEVGKAFVATWNRNTMAETAGVGGRRDALAASLGDGRVLAAGGMQWDEGSSVRSASVYDSATDRWTALPPMPVARAGGAAVALPDGSVLLTGGYAGLQGTYAACNEPLGLASAVRYVPTP